VPHGDGFGLRRADELDIVIDHFLDAHVVERIRVVASGSDGVSIARPTGGARLVSEGFEEVDRRCARRPSGSRARE
jgi:hypothetical protein